MRKTNPLHLFTFGLQRTAGPYRWVKSVAFCNRRPRLDFRSAPLATYVAQDTLETRLRGLCRAAQQTGRYNRRAQIAAPVTQYWSPVRFHSLAGLGAGKPKNRSAARF